MKNIKIRDLYAGKPDAKDEINFEGWDNFIKTFVVADHFNLNLLMEGNHCFITGFKGTGKTALLFYLDDMLNAQIKVPVHLLFSLKRILQMRKDQNCSNCPIVFYRQYLWNRVP